MSPPPGHPGVPDSTVLPVPGEGWVRPLHACTAAVGASCRWLSNGSSRFKTDRKMQSSRTGLDVFGYTTAMHRLYNGQRIPPLMNSHGPPGRPSHRPHRPSHCIHHHPEPHKHGLFQRRAPQWAPLATAPLSVFTLNARRYLKLDLRTGKGSFISATNASQRRHSSTEKG